MKLVKKISLLLITLSASIATAQVQFQTKVSKKNLGVNEQLEVTFEINHREGESFVPPDFMDFTIISGPNESVSNTWVNGKRSSSKAYSYVLKPKKMGDLTIKQASITYKNVVYKTRSTSISVSKAVDLSKKEKEKKEKQKAYILENVHVLTKVAKNNVSLKDSLMISHHIYVSPSVGISSWKVATDPVYSSGVIKDVTPEKIEVETVKYNGKDYRRVIWRQTTLKPETIGTITIEPTEINFDVETKGNRRDIFGGNIYVSRSIHIKSDEVTVNVLE